MSKVEKKINVDVGRRNLLKGGAASAALMGTSAVTLTACGGGAWVPKKTVIVILENKSQLIGTSADMPYLNSLAAASASMTQSYAAPTPYNLIPIGGAVQATDAANPTTSAWTMGAQFSHPLPARGSQTNYMYQFSGHNQGLLPDWFSCPGSGRTTLSSYAAFLLQDQYGNVFTDGAGTPTPKFTGEAGLSNELLTDFADGTISTSLQLPFTTPNLGAAILQTGYTFATFSESLPSPTYNGKDYEASAGVADGYARRHNPAINWINFPAYGKTVAADKQRFLVPVSSNLSMTNTVDDNGVKYPGFAVDKDGNAASFDQLPTVSIVVPNDQDNIHTGTKAAADAWLEANIKPYADWAAANDALLIVTTDEDGFDDASNGVSNVGLDGLIAKYYGGTGSYMYGRNPITTLFYGPVDRVKKGEYTSKIDHLNVLATILYMYGALGQFKSDFQTAWSASVHPNNANWAGGDNPVRKREVAAQIANLTPITEIFS